MNKAFRATWLWMAGTLCLVAILVSFPLLRGSASAPPAREAEATPAPTAAAVSDTQDTALPALAFVTPPPTPTPTPAPTPFSFVWISDTQVYGWRFPDVYEAMARWIVEQREARNFLGMLHVGDVIDNRREEGHWKKISRGMDIMRGEIPRYVVAGNHDVGWPEPEYQTFLSYDFCDVREESLLFNGGQCWVQPITAGGRNLLLLGIGWPGKSDVYLRWAEQQMDAYPTHTVVIVTHSFLATNGLLYSEGLRLEALFADHPNLRLVICGHSGGEGKWEKVYDDGHTVTALMYNLQGMHMEKKGFGFLRILTFDSLRNTMECVSYSPYLDEYNYYDAARDTFTIENVFID
ncbi:MAG: metallophosphoesterase [Clostridiales bacterium]|nr:metallophosphoesterase [Clostridiales bacterium]